MFPEDKARFYLEQAYRAAMLNSDDPNTKNGAVIVARGGPVCSGTNRFPRGIVVNQERLQRPQKYDYILHAEEAAIMTAAFNGVSCENGVMVCPWAACDRCARQIIEAGIVEVVSHKQVHDRTPDRWKEPIAKADAMFKEAGVLHWLFDGKVASGFVHLLNDEEWEP